MPVQGNGSPPASGSGIEDHDHEDETGSAHLTVHEPMARPAPLAGGTGAVYFMLENHGDAPVTLTGAESSASAAVEFHTTINDNGVMRMRQLTDGVTINPGESIDLTPGAMHLMLIDLAAPLGEGDQVEVTLHFTGADDLTFTAPVVNMDDLPTEDSPTEGEHDH
jgi:copper(I)-binding protein